MIIEDLDETKLQKLIQNIQEGKEIKPGHIKVEKC